MGLNQSKKEEFIANPKKALWKLSIPMMLGMSVQSIYMLVDTLLISRIVGETSMAALGFAFPFLFIIMGITFGLGSGATAVIAQFIGANQKEKANNAAEHLLVLGIIVGILLNLLSFFIGDKLMLMQGANEATLKYALDYFYIIVAGSIFMILGVFFRSILSGEGDTLFSMKVLGTGTLVNMVLDPPMIYFYHIKGAAYATLISQIIVFLLFSYSILIKKSFYLNLNLKKIKYNKSILFKIIHLGFPASLSMIVMSIWMLICNKLITFGIQNETEAMAAVGAFQMAGRLENIFFLPIISIASSLVTIVGMFYGAEEFKLIKDIVNYALIRSFLIGVFFCGIFYFFIEHIITPFNADKNTIKYLIQYFTIVPFAYPFITIGMNSSRVMQAIGHALPMLILTILRVLLINALLSFIFIFIYNKDIIYIWYSIILSSVITATIAYLWMKNISRNLSNSKKYYE
tara:strand:- start:3090 stop:4469 length:1380 start_codon:yes stop_codon:yes gene_type:complete